MPMDIRSPSGAASLVAAVLGVIGLLFPWIGFTTVDIYPPTTIGESPLLVLYLVLTRSPWLSPVGGGLGSWEAAAQGAYALWTGGAILFAVGTFAMVLQTEVPFRFGGLVMVLGTYVSFRAILSLPTTASSPSGIAFAVGLDAGAWVGVAASVTSLVPLFLWIPDRAWSVLKRQEEEDFVEHGATGEVSRYDAPFTPADIHEGAWREAAASFWSPKSYTVYSMPVRWYCPKCSRWFPEGQDECPVDHVPLKAWGRTSGPEGVSRERAH